MLSQSHLNYRAFVQSQDKHIAEVSGQLFGHDYNDGLLKDETTVLDSAPPIAAVMVAEQWSKAPAMLHAIQQAHFVKGLKVADAAVLKELANAIAIPVDEFESRYQEAINNQLDEHIQWSRQILREVGANGFPTLVERNNHKIFSLKPHSHKQLSIRFPTTMESPKHGGTI